METYRLSGHQLLETIGLQAKFSTENYALKYNRGNDFVVKIEMNWP